MNELKGTLDALGDIVDVLGLDDGTEIVFQQLCKVVLKLRAAEVDENVVPRGRLIKLAEIGLFLVGEDSQGSGLANTVCADKTENLAGTRGRQSVELERVCRVSVRDLRFEISREVDDGDGAKGALLDADTATNTQVF